MIEKKYTSQDDSHKTNQFVHIHIDVNYCENTNFFSYCTQEPIKPDGTCTCYAKQWPTPPSKILQLFRGHRQEFWWKVQICRKCGNIFSVQTKSSSWTSGLPTYNLGSLCWDIGGLATPPRHNTNMYKQKPYHTCVVSCTYHHLLRCHSFDYPGPQFTRELLLQYLVDSLKDI